VKGYIVINISLDWIIIDRSVQFEESVSYVPQHPHADTFVLPHVRDDEHAHVNSSSYESYDLEDLDNPGIESVKSGVESGNAYAYAKP
jgi:hypothetical protein